MRRPADHQLCRGSGSTSTRNTQAHLARSQRSVWIKVSIWSRSAPIPDRSLRNAPRRCRSLLVSRPSKDESGYCWDSSARQSRMRRISKIGSTVGKSNRWLKERKEMLLDPLLVTTAVPEPCQKNQLSITFVHLSLPVDISAESGEQPCWRHRRTACLWPIYTYDTSAGYLPH
jgi:hypothetical protein